MASTEEKLLTLQLHKAGFPVSPETLAHTFDIPNIKNINPYEVVLDGYKEALNDGYISYDYRGMGKLKGMKEFIDRHYAMGLTREQIIPLVKAIRKRKGKRKRNE